MRGIQERSEATLKATINMNWGSIFSRNPVNTVEAPVIPGTTPLQQQRLKQIESLHSCNKNVVEEDWDRSYSIEFNAGSQLLKLSIKLPSQFPHEKPSVRISPGGKHPWLDDRMYVTGCSSLNNFYMHSNLGKVIRQLIDDFKASPPVNNSTSTSPFGESNTHCDYNVVTSSTPTAILISTASVEEEAKATKTKCPNSCSTIEELVDALSRWKFEELEAVSEDATQLISFAKHMDVVKDIQEERRTIIESNREIAESNLTFKTKMQDLQNSIATDYDNIQNLQSQLAEKMAKQDELFKAYDMNQIITNLQIAISQAEEESEDIAESFLEKKMPVDEFLQRYLRTRKTIHLRKAKEERIRYLNPRS